MTRVAIYARYSSDLQKATSIEDQVRICQERADREGWEVVNCYTDPAISGTTMLMRPGVRMLMQDAASGMFDIVLTEALDRLSRDQADMAAIYKRLSFKKIQIVTLSEGDVGLIDVGLRGVMNQLYIVEMAKKVKRGQRGRVEAGKITAGKAFGYDVVKQFDARGELIRGERSINEDQAEIVRRIFREYASGRSPKAIAAQLNREGHRSPAGRGWNQSTINGRREAGYGILNNSLYIGEIVWNRVSERRCPDTGRVLRNLNPESEWIRKQAPEFRIVTQELWDAVKLRQEGLAKASSGQFWAAQRPRYLLSGLLRCGECGGAYCRTSHDRYGCATIKNRGTCTNRINVTNAELERSVLFVLENHLLNAGALNVFCAEYTSQVNRLRMERNAQRQSYKLEIGKLEKEKRKLIDAILNDVPAALVKDELIQNDQRKVDLEARLNATEEAPVLLHPSMAKHYADSVTRLITALDSDHTRVEAQDLIRSMIEKIVLRPNQNRTALEIDLHGDLAGILQVAENKRNMGETNAASPMLLKLVGPEGFEPPT